MKNGKARAGSPRRKRRPLDRVTRNGKRYVLVPEHAFNRLTKMPALPAPDAQGNYPALEAASAIMAREIIEKRTAAALSQAELARRAGVPVVTLNRLERGHRVPRAGTVDKIDKALRKAMQSPGTSHRS